LFEEPCWPIDTTYFIHTPIELLLRYFYYQLNTLELATLDKSTTIPGLNRDHLYDVMFALAPIKEQARIVEKLEELLSDLDAGVAELKAAQKKLGQYRQALLKAAVEGALTAEWRKKNKAQETGAQLLARILAERRKRWEEKQRAKFKEQGKTPPKGWQDKYSEPMKPEATNLPELPAGWVWASVDQCSAYESAAITDGPFGSNLKSAHYTESGPRVIRLKNIGEGVFVDAQAHISEDHYQSLNKHAVEAEDVVVAMLGEDLPRACLIPEGVAPGIVKADCARIRVNRDALLPDFLNACLNSRNTKQRVASLIKGIGRPRINLQHIRGICIPLPSFAEQTQIVSVINGAFDEVNQQLDAIQLSLKQSSAQRKNILKSAFSGQLVPQDPTDEPASVLLERIRAERATRESSSKKRGVRKKMEGI
jgi:type I restriction enzyme S subunit